MTPERDVHDAPKPQRRADYVAAPRDEDPASTPSREINERRARVENTELLRHLRGL